MDFVGTGERLKQGDIGEIAKSIGLPTSALLAILEVEAAGRGFDAKNRPIILYEPHVFYRELGAGSKRNAAVKAGLAYAKWGSKPYPKGFDDRYAQLQRAMTIDETAALKSASWGMPQIMGFNHKAAAFPKGPAQMVEAFKQGERQQVQGMAALIEDWGIAATLKGKNLNTAASWNAFTSRYNGKGQVAKYSAMAAAAHRKHAQGKVDDLAVPSPRVVVLKEGMKGEEVRNLQAALDALGYDFGPRPSLYGPVDGRFGPDTGKAVRAFQEAEGLAVDGAAGKQVRERLAERSATGAAKPPMEWPRPEPNIFQRIIDAILDWLASVTGR